MAAAVVSEHGDTKFANRFWMHLKILYLLVTTLSLLSLALIGLLLLEVTRRQNGNENDGKMHVSSCDNDAKLIRLKRSYLKPQVRRERENPPNGSARRNRPRNETTNDDWVWMSSFSRVPSTVMQEFCASTKNYCPPGFPGRPGPPGKRGEAGKQGEKGANGTDGVPGAEGPQGQKGDKGDTGIEGPSGFNGSVGEPGPSGADGDPGQPGRRGEKGDKGDKGEATAQNRNCNCPQGPKGSKGEPGYLASDSLVSWLKGNSKGSDFASQTSVESCRIRLVSKPRFQKHTGSVWGSWMRDLTMNENRNKVWVTKHYTDNVLYEYYNMVYFRKDKPSKTYNLTYYFYGTGHTVYQGNFYYQRAGYNEIVMYSLVQEKVVNSLTLEHGACAGSGPAFLYSIEHNYYDFSTDENGVWVIYANESDVDTLLVSKLNHTGLTVSTTLNIPVPRKMYSNGFIACGVLYLIRDSHAKTTHIDFAYDLFGRQNSSVYLTFTNPFQMSTMVTYIAKLKNIFSWDRGNQLIYTVTV